jgi:hypothetical protein
LVFFFSCRNKLPEPCSLYFKNVSSIGEFSSPSKYISKIRNFWRVTDCDRFFRGVPQITLNAGMHVAAAVCMSVAFVIAQSLNSNVSFWDFSPEYIWTFVCSIFSNNSHSISHS